MTERARGPVRSSARLSGGGGGGGAGGGGAAGTDAGAGGAGGAAARALEAARRRARARERALEVEDSPRELRDKCRRLARALVNAKHLVVYTGAGISTAADIPDYRGPRGVWTRLRRGESVGRVEVSRATPTLTHMALTALWARGTLKFVVSQNCDGLHVRAGLPRRALAELHGDMFAERCSHCRRVYLRAFDTTERTARHAHGTRRLCHQCGAELQDTIVHFGERGRAAWPLNWAGALRHAAAADVVLCLGSSLKVLRRYPRLWRMQCPPHARPALYIVNLQWTPKDAVAALKINARCDAVMAQVARRLRLRVPRYEPRADPLLAHAVPLAPPEAHTTRRPLLTATSASSSPSCSPPASDSDDELPLRRLAERMRAPPALPPPPPPPPQPPPPPDLLHAFQVNMRSGDATILLRAQHAPSVPAGGAGAGAGGVTPRRPLSELRMFRMPHRPPPPPPLANGHVLPNGRGPPPHTPLSNGRVCPPRVPPVCNGTVESVTDFLGARSPKSEPDTKREDEEHFGRPPDDELDRKPKVEIKCELKPKEPPDSLAAVGAGAADTERSASALAAAIIARAVLLCRASLYPGLHTILAPEPPRRPRRAECAWCARRYSARRCQWYGPPPPPPPPGDVLAGRAWRRVRGPARRVLCACCEEPAPAAAGDAELAGGGGGWYGKGYRKGRRRRR